MLAVDRKRTEAERCHKFLQARFEEAERRPKHHRMLGEAYGRLTVHLDHYDTDQALEQLDRMRAEAQFFANHPQFPTELLNAQIGLPEGSSSALSRATIVREAKP
ncbi:hypothetical protein ACQF36_29700 [Streptomyces sp. Marseille-Q5077]|uniref:hypothetical protein n=1 Tax=Streptomyces sp. Marseille-Q5077 TaxID=3418995 RepID=UPI003CFC4227